MDNVNYEEGVFIFNIILSFFIDLLLLIFFLLFYIYFIILNLFYIYRWCATDQNASQCGTFSPEANGYVDDCTQAGISNFRFLAPEQMLEWDQSLTTFYTGQNITLQWTPNKLDVNEVLTFTYQGVTLRTLGSNINNTLGTYKYRLTDSTNAPTASAYVLAGFSSSPQLNVNSTNPITVIVSRLVNVDGLIWNNATKNYTSINGQTVGWGQEVNVVWRGIGMAGMPIPGGVTVQLRRGWGGGTQYFNTSYVNAGANNSFYFNIPSGTASNSFFYYTITVNYYGGSYTANTPNFNVAAPSATPTPTVSFTSTPTPSITPTRSPSGSRTPTPSPSQTATTTVSATPTISLTPSTTETARPSIDIAAIARAAQSMNGDSNIGVTIGAVLGTAVAMVGAFLGYHLYQRRKLTQARLRKLKDSARWAANAHDSYLPGKGDVEVGSIAPPQMVVYQVSMNNAPANSLTSRSAYPPQQSAGQYRQPTGRGNSRRGV